MVTQEHIDKIKKECNIVTGKLGARTSVVCVVLANGVEISRSYSASDDSVGHAIRCELALQEVEKELWKLEEYKIASPKSKIQPA